MVLKERSLLCNFRLHACLVGSVVLPLCLPLSFRIDGDGDLQMLDVRLHIFAWLRILDCL